MMLTEGPRTTLTRVCSLLVSWTSKVPKHNGPHDTIMGIWSIVLGNLEVQVDLNLGRSLHAVIRPGSANATKCAAVA